MIEEINSESLSTAISDFNFVLDRYFKNYVTSDMDYNPKSSLTKLGIAS